jgi:hypothetical protein
MRDICGILAGIRQRTGVRVDRRHGNLFGDIPGATSMSISSFVLHYIYVDTRSGFTISELHCMIFLDLNDCQSQLITIPPTKYISHLA